MASAADKATMEDAIAAVKALEAAYPELDAETAAAFALGFKAGRAASGSAAPAASAGSSGAAAPAPTAAAPSKPNFPAPATVPTVAEKWTIYEDDAAIGEKAPTISSAEFIKGDPVKLKGSGLPTCLMFWAKSHKGDYTTIVGCSELQEVYGDYCQFVGIGIDAEKKDSESLLKKIGKAMPNEYIDNFKVTFPLAWDSGKEVKEAYRKKAKTTAITPSAIFLINADGVIVWREQFGQGYEPKKGQIGEQIRRLIMGEELIKNGPTPEEEEEEEEEMEMGDGGDDYDSDLGF